jgi:predicted nucleic acid-binding protein
LNYVFDACALIAFLNDEPEKEAVQDLLKKAADKEIIIHMSIVNFVEVYYNYIQQKGSVEEADKLMQSVYVLPIHTIDTITGTVYRDAARFKGLYSISLADAFACAAAKSLSATLVTKDHEIEAVEKNEKISVLWIK